jgi:ADP-ribosyl-[dinitrogen reductase] hydrolase
MMEGTDRFRGSVLGLATGDALGTSVEFKEPGSFEPVTAMQGGGPFALLPGEWTDDTSMALCVAESLLECNGLDLDEQLRRFVRWRDTGHMSSNGRCFDIGITIREALAQYESTGKARNGIRGPRKAGNGSLMRLAPVPLYFHSDPEKAIQMSGESSCNTHMEPACIDACRYYGALIVGALQGTPKSELLSARYSPVPGYWDRRPLCAAIDEVARGSYKDNEPPSIRGSGYVVKSLEAALWAFHRTESFADGCLLAVNLGDDADTTAAIYGQLAGAYYGAGAIPAAWIDTLAKRELLEDIATRLYRASMAR